MPRYSRVTPDHDLLACIPQGNVRSLRHQSAIARHSPAASSGTSSDIAICRSGTGLDFPLLEFRRLGLNNYFKFMIFFSDFGFSKPDQGTFVKGARKLILRPGETTCLRDSLKNGKLSSAKLGMKAMHIEEAWKHYKTEVGGND